MQRFLTFLMAHPILSGAMLLLIIAYFLLESLRSGKKVSAQALGVMMSRDKAILVDIRDAKAFQEGHISGSRNIPFSHLKTHLEDLKGLNVPIIMICNIGQTAATACQLLGGDNVYRLDGGIMGYKSQGLPLVKGNK